MMMGRETFNARCQMTGDTARSMAERISEALGEPVTEVDIQNRLRLGMGERPRNRVIYGKMDSITLADVEKIRADETERVRVVLENEGVTAEQLEVRLGNRAWGRQDFVFVNGRFYGIFFPKENRWEHKEG